MGDKSPEEGKKEVEPCLLAEQVEKTERYSIIDGSAHNIMVGFGEQYITPFAINLGASNHQLAMLSSIPTFFGAISQVIGARLSEKYSSRKSLMATIAFIQALLLTPLFIIPFLTKSMLLLTILFSVYLILSNMIAPAWNSLMGDLVPEKDRAAYFGKRNKITVLVLFLSILTGGLILEFFKSINIWAGFGILFSIAFFGRMLSWVFLMNHCDPPRMIKAHEHLRFKDFLKGMKDTAFGRFTLFRICVALSAMIAVPFFSIYMLKNLGFTYVQFSAVLLLPMVVKSLTATYWSSYSSRFGNKSIMRASIILVALIPLIWAGAGFFFETDRGTVFILIMIAEVLGGFGWSGFELTTFNYMLGASDSANRARLFAYFNVLFGFAVLLGGFMSSGLVNYFSSINIGVGAILAVFFISFVMRMLVAIFLLPNVPDVDNHPEVDEGRLVLEVLVTRPFGFAIHDTLSKLTFITHGISLAEERTRNAIKKGFSSNHSQEPANNDAAAIEKKKDV